MRIDITFDHSDLIQQVRDLLSVKGLKPVEGEEIQFMKANTPKGAPVQYYIKVACDAGDVLAACPLCNAPVVERSISAGPPVDAPAAPRLYSVVDGAENEGRSQVVLDADLGESWVPPGEADSDEGDDEGGMASIASIRAQSARLVADKDRERAARGAVQGVPSMAGESTRPPKPGDGS